MQQGQLESLSVVLYQHLTRDACFLWPVSKLCGKQPSAKMKAETEEREARVRDGRHWLLRHPRQWWKWALIIENLWPCWENMGSLRLKRRSQRWGSGGVGGHRITGEGWWDRAISWRSAGFGLSLSAFLNSLQSDGHFEVSQSCLNPAWKDAENREAERRDRNIQRASVVGQDGTKDWWWVEGRESNQN